jgi:hypothetical protein
MPATLNGVHVSPVGQGSVASVQIDTSFDEHEVPQCVAVKLLPRLKPQVESSATVPPTPQQTGPAGLPAQSTGPSHCQAMEPTMGHVPGSWHVELLGLVLGASQHCCPEEQWMLLGVPAVKAQ